MANSVDFILPSCYGIPESMWLAASLMLDAILKRCWLLLGAFVLIKMLSSALIDVGEEQFSLKTHLKTLFQALLIAVFFTYYKTFLMVVDYFIDSLCFFDVSVLRKAEDMPEKAIKKGNIITRLLLDNFKEMLVCATQKGAVKFMHYIKSIALLVLSQLGPFAALFSLLPGPFRASFKIWSKGYLHVSCWTLTLSVIDMLASGLRINSEYSQALLSFVLFIVTLFTPTWTAKLISGVNLGSLAASVGAAPGKVVTAMRSTRSLFKGDKK